MAGILYYYSLDIDTDFKEVPLTTIGLQVFHVVVNSMVFFIS